jgi:hypothetical protein
VRVAGMRGSLHHLLQPLHLSLFLVCVVVDARGLIDKTVKIDRELEDGLQSTVYS